MKKYLILIIITFSFIPFSVAQLTRMDQVPVSENGNALIFPFTGGWNLPQFSVMDLDGDSVMDLVVFDRTDGRIFTFINNGQANQVDYVYAPQYNVGFPKMKHWMLLRDYNCDGKMDIFTAADGQNSISVYENTSTGTTMSFQFVILALQDTSSNFPIEIPFSDVPAISDIDGDGDLDILVFDSGGFGVEWHKNLSMETAGDCSLLSFDIEVPCWGDFTEDGLDNTVTLNVSCKGSSGPKHAGSTLATFDQDGDGVMELVLGDLNHNNVVYLHNGGTATSAHFDSDTYFYPTGSPVDLLLFPAVFFVDVNNDGKDDMLVSPSATNVSANYEQIYYYEDTSATSTVNWAYRGRDFMVSDMIDCGEASAPVFFDYNGDGLYDLIVGNFQYKRAIGDEMGSLTLYENVGTNTVPEFELITRDYLGLSTMFSPREINMVPSFGDLDGDGDQDMILGTFRGKVHYFRNDPVAGVAQFSLEQGEYFSIDVGQSSYPQIIDIDGDQLLDLVIGETAGNVNFYKNTGTITSPQFTQQPTNDSLGKIDVRFGNFAGYATPTFVPLVGGGFQLFVGTQLGHIQRYTQVNATGAAVLQDSAWENLDLGLKTSLSFADLDGDGSYEVAVGNQRGGVDLYSTSLSSTVALDRRLSRADLDMLLLPQAESKDVLVHFSKILSRPGSLEVFDMLGKRLHAQAISAGQQDYRIPFSGAAGVYLLKFSEENKQPIVKKWITN